MHLKWIIGTFKWLTGTYIRRITLESIYIIKKNGEMYWNLNTAYKHKSRAERSLLLHLETLVPKVNGWMKERYPHFYKDKTVEEFMKDFEIVRIEI